jgi:hypothetical protein
LVPLISIGNVSKAVAGAAADQKEGATFGMNGEAIAQPLDDVNAT